MDVLMVDAMLFFAAFDTRRRTHCLWLRAPSRPHLSALCSALDRQRLCCIIVGVPQVPLNEYDFPQSKLASVQAQLERLVEKNYYLHQSARDAYR